MIVSIGRIGQNGIDLLATGFAVAHNKIATAAHVIGGSDNNLCVAARPGHSLGDYQDVSDNRVQVIPAKIHAIDPTSDILILSVEAASFKPTWKLSSSDASPPLTDVTILGYPHCPDGRMVLTAQSGAVGARAMLQYGGIKRKHLVLNTLTRPGQSGSPVFQGSRFDVVTALILGTYRSPGPGVIVGNIDPAALNQTTHAISAEYVQELL